MVFPMRANLLEFAADHLDRLLGKSCIDRLVHERGVTQDSHTDRSYQPQGSGYRRRPDEDWDADDKQDGVKLGCGEGGHSQLQIAAVKLSNGKEADAHEDHVKEESQVGEEAVDSKHGCQGEVIALEVCQIVIDPALYLAEVCRFGEPFEIEEISYRFEIGEASGERLRTNPLKA